MKISIQYLAGYFDADGYFCASKDGSGYKFYAGLSSTDRNIVDEFSNRFGGGVLTRLRNKEYNRKKQYDWTLQSSTELRRFIVEISKYLILKKYRSELVLEVVEAICDRKADGRRCSSLEEKERKLTIYTEMSKLNKRGAAVAQSYPLGSFEG